ncbi:MAG: metal ABC transporter solute-binding protein, Zn/Mn family [Spirochaetota bacterium]
MKRMLFVLIVAVSTALGLTAQEIVASTAWTAAFAEAAGAQEVRVLAPYDLAHPPEYELRPSDLRAIMSADLVIYAGYETMVPRLVEAAGDAGAQTLQIQTVHSIPVMRSSIRAIAAALGTQSSATERLAEITGFLTSWREQVAELGYAGVPVAVHFHQQALARELGMNVVRVFGPAPLEARQIDDITQADPVLIIDNGHNPVAAPIAETTGADVSVWYNFPGVEETRTLLDIFRLNREALDATASR